MEVRLKTQASLSEAADLICSIGNTNTIHLVGEPGIGKTAMHESIVKRTGLRGIYIDVPNVELGDLGIPVPSHETKTVSFYPNEFWGFHLNEPLCIFLDEFTKGSQGVQNMLHPLLNERRIGGIKQHKDTIIITAGNTTADGVGDSMKGHTRSRLTVVPVSKPVMGIGRDGRVEEGSWGEWALANDIAGEIITWGKEYPHILASYMDGGQEENPYIYQPKKPQQSYVCPRSLAKASNIVKKRAMYSETAMMAALAGTIGETGARDLVAYLRVADSLPTWESIITNPNTAIVPTSPAALCILAYSALQRIERDTVGKFFEYLKRTPKELQSVFCLSGLKNEKKKTILATSTPFVTWMRENQYLF